MRDFKKLLIWQQGMIIVDKIMISFRFYWLSKNLKLKQSKKCSPSSLIKLVVDMKTACSLLLEA
jgi:hypothetical protein